MSRLSRPLSRDAVRKADDAFYANHPEFVQNGRRIPLSTTDPKQSDLRKEWTALYQQNGGGVESDREQLPETKPGTATASCPLTETNWVELEYLYADGTGVANACYVVKDSESGALLAEGTLDECGYAWVDLPNEVETITSCFEKDPPTVEYLREPIPNPELPKVKAGWLDRMYDTMADAGSWTWGVVQGDFNEDPTIAQVAANTAITMIPILDQIGDIRDIVASLKALIFDKRYNDKWVWIGLVLTLIGLIPVLGSAAKGVLKIVFKGLKTTGKVPLKLLIETLNTLHKGNAVKWLRELAANLPQHASAMKKTFSDILTNLRGKLQILSKVSGKADEMVQNIDEVAEIASKKIDEAVETLQDALNKSLDEGVDFERKGAVRSKHRRKQRANDSDFLIERNGFYMSERKNEYFFGGVEPPDPKLKETDPKKYKKLEHNYKRSQQMKAELEKVDILDNEKGKEKLLEIFDDAAKNQPITKPHNGPYGTTLTKSTTYKGTKFEVKYFYKNGNMQNKPEVVSMIPKS